MNQLCFVFIYILYHSLGSNRVGWGDKNRISPNNWILSQKLGRMELSKGFAVMGQSVYTLKALLYLRHYKYNPPEKKDSVLGYLFLATCINFSFISKTSVNISLSITFKNTKLFCMATRGQINYFRNLKQWIHVSIGLDSCYQQYQQLYTKSFIKLFLKLVTDIF